MKAPLFELGRMYFPPMPGRDHFFAWFLGYNEAPHVRMRLGFYGRIQGFARFQRGCCTVESGEIGHGWQLRVWRVALCVFFPER